jgi:TolA-binding protein
MSKKNLFMTFVLSGLVFLGIADKCIAGASEKLVQADTYWKNGNFGQAKATYQAVATNYPKTDYALEAQKKLVMLYKHEQPQAMEAFQELITTFSTHELLAKTIFDISIYYKETESYKKYEMIKLFCQHILNTFPKSEYAVWAQSKIAISNIALGDESSAQIAFDTLISKFSENEHAAKATYDVAHQYNVTGNYEGAEKIYQRIINTWTTEKKLMWTQVEMAHSNISHDNDDIAQIAIGILVDKISMHEIIPGALYDIAQHYGRVNMHERARWVYQQVLDKVPSDYYAIWSAMGVAMSSISLDDNTAAQAAIDKLITDFSRNPRISDAVFAIAYHYDNLHNYAKARQYYQYILDHWPTHEHHALWTVIHLARMNIILGEPNTAELVIDNLVTKLNADVPLYSYWTDVAGEAYRLAGEIYIQLGKYEKAIQLYQQVLDTWPDYKYAGEISFLIGNYYERLMYSGLIPKSEAESQMEKFYKIIVERYPDCSRFKYAAVKLAENNFDREDWDDAAYYFELLLNEYPEGQKPSRILFALAQSYDKMGLLSPAKEFYNAFIDTAPETDPRMKIAIERYEDIDN